MQLYWLAIVPLLGQITYGAVFSFHEGSISPTSVNLGKVDDKTYLADNVTRNWTMANEFCKNSSMRLASVSSLQQMAFLTARYGPDFTGYFWTGGRDAQTAQQFVWDHSRLPVQESFINFYSPVAAQTGVVYYSDATNAHFRSGTMPYCFYNFYWAQSCH